MPTNELAVVANINFVFGFEWNLGILQINGQCPMVNIFQEAGTKCLMDANDGGDNLLRKLVAGIVFEWFSPVPSYLISKISGHPPIPFSEDYAVGFTTERTNVGFRASKRMRSSWWVPRATLSIQTLA